MTNGAAGKSIEKRNSSVKNKQRRNGQERCIKEVKGGKKGSGRAEEIFLG